MPTVIWLDDERNPGDRQWGLFIKEKTKYQDYGLYWVKTPEEFIHLVKNLGSYENLTIFFDNDLGVVKKSSNHIAEGRDCFNWLEKFIIEYNLPPIQIFSQSSNNPARNAIERGVKALERYWKADKGRVRNY